MSDALAKALADAKVKRVGFEANFTTVGQVDALDKAREGRCKDTGPSASSSWSRSKNVMANIRKVKDDHEIDLIRKSVGVAEEAFDADPRARSRSGQTENYLAGLLVFELRSRGASNSSFPVIVAAGANSSLPHYRPGETLVQRDQPLLIDWGALYKGYCSRPDAHADGRPRQPEDEADLQGRATRRSRRRSSSCGPGVTTHAGRPRRPRRDREGRLRQVVRPRPRATASAATSTSCRRCARPAARKSSARG